MRQLLFIISLVLLSAARITWAAPATHLEFCPPHTGCAFGIFTLGVFYNLPVYAIDANGDLATNYEGTVAITSTDQFAMLPPAHTFTLADGSVFTFSIAFNSLPSGYPSVNRQNVTATDSVNGISGSVQFAVVPARTQVLETAPVLPQPFRLLLILIIGGIAVGSLALRNRAVGP